MKFLPLFSSLKLLTLLLLGSVSLQALAELDRIEVIERRTLTSEQTDFQYQIIQGIMYFTLDPRDADNQKIVDITFAPVNGQGLVEYSADFKLLVPSANIANGSLVYMVNNRGGGRTAPEISLTDPLAKMGFTYLLTGWINELEPGDGRLLLRAPVVGSLESPITGEVRYEIIVGSAQNDVNIADNGHLAYAATEAGNSGASLSYRLNQQDARVPLERSQFQLNQSWIEGSNQPVITLNLQGGFQPGYIYELIYEAKNPVLAGAGMAGIRDSVSLLRYGETSNSQLAQQLAALEIPAIERSIAIGNSQSGRLLRLFLYEGFNADLEGRKVFDGVIPVIAGAGFGMFNNRFAMPTRTNGQHENLLFPNDYFPFTYGDSVDPYSGRSDGILKTSRESNTEPRVMHIQTSNEYWLRGGSLPHTDPLGNSDAEIPDNVRFYTLGGSQHGSGNGQPRAAAGGQLPGNPNMWAPLADSLLAAMHYWIADDKAPPASRYPMIANGSLVASHIAGGAINPKAWNTLPGINHPKAIYQVGFADYGSRWQGQGIVDQHPMASDSWYGNRVPAVNSDNNDFASSTVLPPLTAVPLATFVPWNLRALATGADTELARLSGGYIPFAANASEAVQSNDPRQVITGLYKDFAEYLVKYEAATDKLIAEGYLLPGYKDAYMTVARQNQQLFQ